MAPPRMMTNRERKLACSLDSIAAIIEAVDDRAMAADGPVTPTRLEMTDREMREIYRLATGKRRG